MPKQDIAEFFSDVDRRAVNVEVSQLIEMYRQSADARFFWRAYLRLREAGQPIPENFLAKIAQWAEKAIAAPTDGIAAALDFVGHEKRQVGPSRAASFQRDWNHWNHVKNVQRLFNVNANQALQIVAANSGPNVTLNQVKGSYNRVERRQKKQRPKSFARLAPGSLDAAMGAMVRR